MHLLIKKNSVNVSNGLDKLMYAFNCSYYRRRGSRELAGEWRGTYYLFNFSDSRFKVDSNHKSNMKYWVIYSFPPQQLTNMVLQNKIGMTIKRDRGAVPHSLSPIFLHPRPSFPLWGVWPQSSTIMLWGIFYPIHEPRMGQFLPRSLNMGRNWHPYF